MKKTHRSQVWEQWRRATFVPFHPPNCKSLEIIIILSYTSWVSSRLEEKWDKVSTKCGFCCRFKPEKNWYQLYPVLLHCFPTFLLIGLPARVGQTVLECRLQSCGYYTLSLAVINCGNIKASYFFFQQQRSCNVLYGSLTKYLLWRSLLRLLKSGNFTLVSTKPEVRETPVRES